MGYAVSAHLVVRWKQTREDILERGRRPTNSGCVEVSHYCLKTCQISGSV